MDNFDIGIMQGRLSNKSNLPLQSFPINSWEFEFNRANNIGFKKIEWLIDKENDYKNPFFFQKRQRKNSVFIKTIQNINRNIMFTFFDKRFNT